MWQAGIGFSLLQWYSLSLMIIKNNDLIRLYWPAVTAYTYIPTRKENGKLL